MSLLCPYNAQYIHLINIKANSGLRQYIFRLSQYDTAAMTANDEESETEAEVTRSSSAELARCQECTGSLDMCFGLFLMLAFVLLQYMPQLLQKDR